jgi:cytochrome c oxidase assembly protein subunit 15
VDHTQIDVRKRERRRVAAWLLVCAALVFAMVVVGGVTRLTRSGLSIVEWQPLVGAIPPLSDADWQALFAKYRETPEFKQVNFDIGLDGFKRIFWWEYAHRLLGRLIGVAFLLPFLWFLARRSLDPPLAWKLAGVFALGALQGALGWFMVKSGLVDDPRVSHFRLTAHLGVALTIFAAMLWIALDLLRGSRVPAASSRSALALVGTIFVMALAGGMVAGLRAGSAYNTFPLMNGHLVPPEILMLEPWWKNFLYNMATVQFVHRAIGWVLIAWVPWFWWRAMSAPLEPRQRFACHLLLGALALQVTLGIATLVLAVPVALAAAHQAGAVLLLGISLWVASELRSSLGESRSIVQGAPNVGFP